MAERSNRRDQSGTGPPPGRDAAGRWLPGNRGGPGRREGSRNAATAALDRIMAEDGEAVARAVIAAAKGSDMQAAKLVLDRIQPVRKGRPVPLALPEVTTADGMLKALAAVVARLADGTLTPDEAATIASVVAAPKAILEVQEFERRIVELERRVPRR